MDDERTTVAELRRMALAFRDERDWAQFHRPKDLALAINIEAGELAETFLWRSEAEIAEQLARPAFRERVADELADVVLFALYMADAVDLDLARAVRDKVERNRERYPVDRAYGSAAKYTDLGEGG